MTRPGDAAAPAATGPGRQLGLELRRWLDLEPERLRSSQAIANRLIDALGADDSLRGPIRDLSSRPQLLQALHGQGTSRQAAVSNLAGQLEQTYAPTVLRQLLDLLEAATGVCIEDSLECSAWTSSTFRTIPPTRQAICIDESRQPLSF